jgi:predicted AAA+ superfamily ATPase
MDTISDDDLLRRLAFDNPWWAFTEATRIHFRHPPKRAYFAAFSGRVRAAAGTALVLAGPLRAGKTVLLRQTIAEMIGAGASPRGILYVALTTPSYAGSDLTRLVGLFAARHGHDGAAPLHLFFDEVEYVRDWRQALAAVAKAWPKARIVAAVSSGAPALVSGPPPTETGIETFVLPPLTFAEFLRFRDSEAALFGAAGEPGSALSIGRQALVALNEEFHRYVNFGGFPEGVLAKANGAPAPTFVRDGIPERVLHKDLASLAGVNDARELNRLFAILALNTGRELALEDLAAAAGIAKNTLRKYLDHLEGAFLIRRLARVDRLARRFQRAVAFKVHLTAPCLYAALFGPVPADDPRFPRLAETALAAQWLGDVDVGNLAYASWRGGGVALLTMAPGGGRPERAFEIDWSDAYGEAGNKPRTLAEFVGGTNEKTRAYILTRTVARPASMASIDITLVPLALYAYWLGRGAQSPV